jgi:hypothetical protein
MEFACARKGARNGFHSVDFACAKEVLACAKVARVRVACAKKLHCKEEVRARELGLGEANLARILLSI